ncbi:MAG: tight adherence protein C [Kiritimatiellia bacterium]|jgi:tight adherence protein C
MFGGTWTLLLFAFLTFGVGATAGVLMLMGNRKSSADRLSELTGTDSFTKAETERDQRIASAVAARLSKLATPQDQESRNLLQAKLVHAGYRNRNASDILNALRVALVFLLPVIASPLLVTYASEIIYIVAGVILLAAVGYMGPMMIVNRRIEARHKRLLAPFPDSLDLLVTSVEAGLGLDMAFRRVADELHTAAPELSMEFQLVNHEVSAGVPRMDAFRHLADRTGLPEIKSLVNMMVQADRFGTSIAHSLRIHADLVRQRRMSRAEEEAAKVSPKLTIVMILFLMPCLLIVLLGPAAIKVKDAFGGGE